MEIIFRVKLSDSVTKYSASSGLDHIPRLLKSDHVSPILQRISQVVFGVPLNNGNYGGAEVLGQRVTQVAEWVWRRLQYCSMSAALSSGQNPLATWPSHFPTFAYFSPSLLIFFLCLEIYTAFNTILS